MKIKARLMRFYNNLIVRQLYKLTRCFEDIHSVYEFPHAVGAFRGYFQSFEEAQKSAPKDRLLGWDNANAKQVYANRFKSILAQRQLTPVETDVALTDYQTFFWLQAILRDNPNASVFDLGGACGAHYFTFETYFKQSPINWEVCEVPSIVESSTPFIKDIPDLSFTTDSTHAKNHVILLSSGAIQYIQNCFDMLKNILGGQPTHIILNRIPIQERVPTFVSLQNIRHSYSPNYIFNRQEFLHFFETFGYELIAQWQDHLDSACIPFHRKISCNYYHGFYLRKSKS